MKRTPATTKSTVSDEQRIEPTTEKLVRSFYAFDYKTFGY
jgi:hypothetical protein